MGLLLSPTRRVRFSSPANSDALSLRRQAAPVASMARMPLPVCMSLEPDFVLFSRVPSRAISLAMWDNVVVIFEVLIRQLICLILAARRTQEILMLRKELQYDITNREN